MTMLINNLSVNRHHLREPGVYDDMTIILRLHTRMHVCVLYIGP